MYDVKKHGAVGDGVTDDSSAIQTVLDGGRKEIFIPAGRYRIARTLKVESFTSIVADPDARLFICGETDHDKAMDGEKILLDETSSSERIELQQAFSDLRLG